MFLAQIGLYFQESKFPGCPGLFKGSNWPTERLRISQSDWMYLLMWTRGYHSKDHNSGLVRACNLSSTMQFAVEPASQLSHTLLFKVWTFLLGSTLFLLISCDSTLFRRELRDGAAQTKDGRALMQNNSCNEGRDCDSDMWKTRHSLRERRKKKIQSVFPIVSHWQSNIFITHWTHTPPVKNIWNTYFWLNVFSFIFTTIYIVGCHSKHQNYK